MLAPSSAARLAIARPMPREAPVTKRVLPWSVLSGVLFILHSPLRLRISNLRPTPRADELRSVRHSVSAFGPPRSSLESTEIRLRPCEERFQGFLAFRPTQPRGECRSRAMTRSEEAVLRAGAQQAFGVAHRARRKRIEALGH